MERHTDKYAFFWGGLLSNFSHCEFLHQFGVEQFTVYSSEQAFMLSKALHFGDDESVKKMLDTNHPGECKRLGRLVRNYDDSAWSNVRYSYMVAANHGKYSQSEMHRHELKMTKDRIIVEASPKDTIWGIGLHWSHKDVLDESKWKGQNLLGKALMEVRKMLFS